MTLEIASADDSVALPVEPQLRQAALALRDNRADAAEPVLRQYLEDHPDDPNALKLLADVALCFECYADAEELLRRCIKVAPGFDAARYRYAELLFRVNKAHLAIEQVDRLLQRNPDNFECRSLRAIALARIGRFDEAFSVHQALIERHPERPGIWLNYASDLKGAGRQREAIAAYREAIARFPGLVEAYWSLGNLKTFRFQPEDLEAMRGQLVRSDLAARDRCLLHFTLGKAMEDAAAFRESFDHYSQANALQRGMVRYDADQTSRLFARIRATVTPDLLSRHAGSGCPAGDPIFVLGLPRSGSTLVEQILSSHPAVEATMELSNIAAITERFDGPYPEVLRELDPDVFLALGEEYLEDTRAFRSLGRSHFIDKMPENFRHVGLIHLMLPNARIVDVRRHPLGCGFSNFRQDFESDYAFSYDLDDIGRYYRDYVELMAHYDRVMPGKIHRVFYERLIENPEAETRRLLAYLDLPFDEACLRFHETSRPIRTASSEQVRQPIFTSAVDQWQNYDQWLEPLKRALGPVLSVYPEVPPFTVPSVDSDASHIL
jgi:tetratricopeptide (TPR) repeat protein